MPSSRLKRKIVFMFILMMIMILLNFIYWIESFARHTNDEKSNSTKTHRLSRNNPKICTPWIYNDTEQVIIYRLSPNKSYHHEFRYELNHLNNASKSSRLMLFFTGGADKCDYWWRLSAPVQLLSYLRSEGFSILAICTPRLRYDPSLPIQKNQDVIWISRSLQTWIREIYFKQFQHYPTLYAFGLSNGAEFLPVLCRVIPIRAQIHQMGTCMQPALLIPSDLDPELQNRLQLDSHFANWYYMEYCSHTNYSIEKRQCPFSDSKKNYFFPIPPITFLAHKVDAPYRLKYIPFWISTLRNISLASTLPLLKIENAFKMAVAHPINISKYYMSDHYLPWKCKPYLSEIFFKQYTESRFIAKNPNDRVCSCSGQDFLYFERYPNETSTWTDDEHLKYQEYARSLKTERKNFCWTICGSIKAHHRFSSTNVDIAIIWMKYIDNERHRLLIDDFSKRPLRLWMYNHRRLVIDLEYQNPPVPDNSTCARNNPKNQMYSIQHFFFDYVNRLQKQYPISKHNLTWTKNPLLADYYILPHQYPCFYWKDHLVKTNNTLVRNLTSKLNAKYFIPMLDSVRHRYPYWNISNGSNHLLFFATEKNAGITLSQKICDILANVIQLGLTGFRQDLLSKASKNYYDIHDGNVFYRHNYDIIVPPFDRHVDTRQSEIDQNVTEKSLHRNKKILFFFAGSLNHSVSVESPCVQILNLHNRIGKSKEYPTTVLMSGKNLTTLMLLDEHMPDEMYLKTIAATVLTLCLEGFSPWSPRIFESIIHGSIPLIVTENIVLPFEKFIDWRSFTVKMNPKTIDLSLRSMMKFKNLSKVIEQKLNMAKLYGNAFEWPYSAIDRKRNQHEFRNDIDSNKKRPSVFHYIGLELRCRRLEQLYGLTVDSFSAESVLARRRACENYPSICPCGDENQSLSTEEYF